MKLPHALHQQLLISSWRMCSYRMHGSRENSSPYWMHPRIRLCRLRSQEVILRALELELDELHLLRLRDTTGVKGAGGEGRRGIVTMVNIWRSSQ